MSLQVGAKIGYTGTDDRCREEWPSPARLHHYPTCHTNARFSPQTPAHDSVIHTALLYARLWWRKQCHHPRQQHGYGYPVVRPHPLTNLPSASAESVPVKRYAIPPMCMSSVCCWTRTTTGAAPSRTPSSTLLCSACSTRPLAH